MASATMASATASVTASMLIHADLQDAGAELWKLRAPGDVAGLSATAVNYALCLGFTLLCFVVSALSDNYSAVDKLWSITPWVYVWVWAVRSQGDLRLVTMAVVSTVWGIRLTLNFNRRGGYAWPPWGGEEDYRWVFVRRLFGAKENPVAWQIFNLVVISFFQHAVLLGITLPAQAVYALKARASAQPFGLGDVVLSAAILGLVAFEAVADNEQFEFQTTKYAMLKSARNKLSAIPAPYSRGFNTQGLFALSRHPNYFAELSIWVLFTGYAFLALGYLDILFTVSGAMALISIFAISIPLSESITSEKYPLFAEYQRQVPILFPYGRGAKFDDEPDDE